MNSAGSQTGSKSSGRGAGYRFQRFEGEGQDDYSQFESVNILSLEAAEALCSRMKEGIPVEVRRPACSNPSRYCVCLMLTPFIMEFTMFSSLAHSTSCKDFAIIICSTFSKRRYSTLQVEASRLSSVLRPFGDRGVHCCPPVFCSEPGSHVLSTLLPIANRYVTQDRNYGSTIFKQCFVGSQAVDWMCDMNIVVSREEAVAIGQRLVEFGLIDHVNSVFRYFARSHTMLVLFLLLVSA